MEKKLLRTVTETRFGRKGGTCESEAEGMRAMLAVWRPREGKEVLRQRVRKLRFGV